MISTIIFGGVLIGNQRRRFTREFKIEAVRLIVKEGRRMSELSVNLESERIY
ncbi:transposase [Nitrospina gracilis]|nr:transposase [Nitrospina gracilis]